MIQTADLINKLEEEFPYLSEEEVFKLAMEMSVLAFAEICCSSTLKQATPEIHLDVYDALMDPSVERLATVLPRGFAKSSLMSFIFPLWLMLTSKEPLFVIICSESRDQAVNFLSRIKNALEYNLHIRKYYGFWGEKTARRWREDDIILRNGFRIMVRGTGQKIRGAIEQDNRVNIFILDDIESEHNAKTDEGRAANREWVTAAVMPCLATEGVSKLLCIGTIISEDCFLMHCKHAAEQPNSRWRIIWENLINDKGESSWPEKFPMDKILASRQEYEALGNLSAWYQEYMNQPQAPEEAPFKPEYFRTYSNEVKRLGGRWHLVDEKRYIPLNTYMGVDLASSMSVSADFTVMLTIGVDRQFNIYVLDIIRSKSDPAKHPDMILEEYKKWKHNGVFIESIAYQEACRAHVRRKMQEEGFYIPGIERKITHKTAKSERLLSLVPLFAKHKIFFRPGDIQATLEFKAFPKGSHDDIPDALWLAVNFAKAPVSHATVIETKDKKDKIFIDGWVL